MINLLDLNIRSTDNTFTLTLSWTLSLPIISYLINECESIHRWWPLMIVLSNSYPARRWYPEKNWPGSKHIHNSRQYKLTDSNGTKLTIFILYNKKLPLMNCRKLQTCRHFWHSTEGLHYRQQLTLIHCVPVHLCCVLPQHQSPTPGKHQSACQINNRLTSN